MSQNTTTPSRDWYRRRAITRKIFREGTGLAVDRMTTLALEGRLHAQAATLRNGLEALGVADPALARAAVEIDDICTELVLRGVQLQLPI